MAWITLAEAARQFKISRTTLRRRIRSGQLTRHANGMLDTADLTLHFKMRSSGVSEIEQYLCQFYQTLSEKDRQGFAAVQAMQLGDGGIAYIANILGCDPQTIKDGIRELKQLPDDSDHL